MPFSDEVRRINLPIYSCPGCGGHQLSVRMQTGSSGCSTTVKESFSSGDTLTWSGHQLGDCQQFRINSRTRIGLHTSDTNEYAVQGTMTIHTDSNNYHATIPNAWRSRSDNSKTYGITESGKCSLNYNIVLSSNAVFCSASNHDLATSNSSGQTLKKVSQRSNCYE